MPLPKSDLLLRLVAASLAGSPIGDVIGEHRQRCLQALRDLEGPAAEATARLAWPTSSCRAPPCTSRPSCAGSTTATTC